MHSPDFAPYLGRCQFNDCAHMKEPGCRVLEAVSRGEIEPTGMRVMCGCMKKRRRCAHGN